MSALAESLVAAQSELPCALGKDADGQIGQRSYRYLTLDKLIAETRPTLTAHGLSIVQHPSYIERGEDGAIPALTTSLRHEAGESINWTMPLYLSEKTMQGLGAAITYARRGERRYRRKVASAKQWQRIIAAKGGPCRVCRDPASNGSLHSHVQFHHLVPRSAGGDDVADNIVPLCQDCHGLATLRNPLVLEVLARSLTDGEYAYIIGKMGEGALARLFGAGV